MANAADNVPLMRRVASRWLGHAPALALLLVATVMLTRMFANHITSDMPSHVVRAPEIVAGRYYMPHALFHYLVYGVAQILQGWMAEPQALSVAGLIVTVLTTAATLWLTHWLLVRWPGGLAAGWRAEWAACALCIVTPLYLPVFNRYLYLGQWSPTIWHSPTYLMVKPLMILVFAWTLDLLSGGLVARRGRVLLAVALLASVWAKPSFAFSFLPAVALFMLLRCATRWRLWLTLGLVALPTLLLLGRQFLDNYYATPAGGTTDMRDHIVVTWFGLLRYYSPNLVVSALLALAFPVSVIVLDWRAAWRDDGLVLAWLNTGVAYLQAGLLAEAQKFVQGAFTFGYSLSLFLLMAGSVVRLTAAWRAPQPSRWQRAMRVAGAGLLVLHVGCGVYYLVQILGTGSYY